MTPLLGTKNPSAPVGDKSGGDRRAARSLLSCALWRGMGRLWRGMGGMGGMERPEPLAAHHPHQQQGLSGFHETRPFCFPVHDCSPLFTIVRHCSAKNIVPEPVSAPRRARCGGCRPLRRQRGRWVFHETRNTAFMLFTRHETRDTNHGLYAFLPTISHDFPAFPAILRPPLPPRETVSEPRQPFSVGFTTSLHFSPRGEAKCVRGPSGRGASRLARAGVLEQYVEHGKQAQRSPGGHIACFDRRVVRNAGWRREQAVPAALRDAAAEANAQ